MWYFVPLCVIAGALGGICLAIEKLPDKLAEKLAEKLREEEKRKQAERASNTEPDA